MKQAIHHLFSHCPPYLLVALSALCATAWGLLQLQALLQKAAG